MNKEEVKQMIENGTKCYYQRGLSWKGASKREISKEEALALLPKYSFGTGFYELSIEDFGVFFNELSENDLL
jgi:hypothetical protein